ncbi:MAG: hypothetical protein DRI44_02085 [Chlamydiae bacterium]|nr:MAG: hypothetical protein DRI44_02085 [Chlamydiota bacterium]
MLCFNKIIFTLCFAGILINSAFPQSVNPDNLWQTGKQELIPTNNYNSNTVIMIHGFAGSPFDFKPLAIKLMNRGYRVVLPATPGQLKQNYSSDFHDYQPEYYIKWINNLVSNEIEVSDGKVSIVGFSMGGTISTIAAATNKIDKLVLIAPFYSLTTANNFIWKVSRFFARFIQGIPNLTLGAINDPIGNKKYIPGSKIIRLDSYDSLERLAQVAVKRVPQIKVPTLVVGSINDKVASFLYTKSLFEKKKNVKIIEYKKSNHVIIYDYDKDSVISNILCFLENK